MLTPHCSAASGMVAPPSIASTTRLRKSSEYGFAIHAGLLPVGSLNHIRARMGIPDSAFSGNALVTVSSMLPPLPSQRGLQRNGIFGATARLQHLLPTLHEWCCHHPCKARFRLAGSPLPGGRSTLWTATKGFRSHSRSPFLDLSWRKKGHPSSLVQLRIAVWTGVTRDTRPRAEVA